jgi:hypothetical protein
MMDETLYRVWVMELNLYPVVVWMIDKNKEVILDNLCKLGFVSVSKLITASTRKDAFVFGALPYENAKAAKKIKGITYIAPDYGNYNPY